MTPPAACKYALRCALQRSARPAASGAAVSAAMAAAPHCIPSSSSSRMCLSMRRVEIHMETQRLLHLPFRRGVQPRQPDLHRQLFEPGVADEALDILLDGI